MTSTGPEDTQPRGEHPAAKAFARLSEDTTQVDPMAALHTYRSGRRSSWATSAPALGLAAAAVVAVFAVGAFFALQNDATDVAVTTDAEQPDGQLSPDPDVADPGGDASSGAGVALGDVWNPDFVGPWVLVRGVVGDGKLFYAIGSEGDVTLNIDADADGAALGGSAACNGYGGTISSPDGVRIVATEVNQTEIACSPPVLMSIEQEYLGAIQVVDRLAIVNGQLEWTGGGAELIFDRVAPTPDFEMVGITWQLTTIVDGDFAMSVDNLGTTPWIRFGVDGKLEGSTGCRGIDGEWFLAADSVAANLALSGVCRDIGDQDARVVNAFAGPFSVDISGTTLTVTATSGTESLVYTVADEATLEAIAAAATVAATAIDVSDPTTPFTALSCGGTPVHQLVEALGLLDQVADIFTHEEPGCRRTVLLLQAANGKPASLGAEDIDIEIMSDGGAIIRLITDDGRPLELNFDLGERVAPELDSVAFQAQDRDGNRYVYVNQGAGDITVHTLEDPPRVVVDTVLAGTSGPIVLAGVVLPEELNRGDFGRTMPMTVTGYARPFEAQGTVSLRSADGEPVMANWSGFELLGDVTDSRYFFRTRSIDAWGEFSVTFDGLAPGDYQLVFENDAAGEGFEYAVPFTVIG